jgi:hypothetical protein
MTEFVAIIKAGEENIRTVQTRVNTIPCCCLYLRVWSKTISETIERLTAVPGTVR